VIAVGTAVGLGTVRVFGACALAEAQRCRLCHRDLDAQSVNPGEAIFEKLVSGLYLGEVRTTAVPSRSSLQLFDLPR